MRVIAGQWKGRRLRAPRGFELRPTSDKVKGALLNILGSRVEGARMVDLFAGTGSVGIEVLSRGASHVTFVEEDPSARAVLQANLKACGASAADFTVWKEGGVAGWLGRLKRRPDESADLIFADPPYHRPETLRLLRPFAAGLGLSEGGWLVIEHVQTADVPPPVSPMTALRTYRYGETMLSIYTKVLAPESPESP